MFAAELAWGWNALASAAAHLGAPHTGWLAAALAAEVISMGAYARMQRRLLRSAGVCAPLSRHVALAYAAHSLSVTLPGGPAFSTRLNYQQMRRFGASPAVASWSIALSGILSATALAVITVAGTLGAQETLRWPDLAGLVVAALLVTVGVRWVVRRPHIVIRVLGALLGLLNRVRRRSATNGIERVEGFVGQLRAARLSPLQAAAASGFALLNWLLDAACLGACLLAVGGSVSPSDLLLAFCLGMAASTITLVPGGLGIIDSALTLGLTTGGVGTATAIAAVVLYRIISFGFVIGTGWIFWLIIRRRGRTPVTSHP